MKLNNEFTVAAPLERTWATLLDVGSVAGCLPGATVEPVGEEGLYRGQLRLKVGPLNMSYAGTVRLLDVDTDEHIATFEARAKETRGTGTAAAVIRNHAQPTSEGTRVQVQTELAVTGRPAQFGRGLMEDVASRMLSDFGARLEQLVLAGSPTPPSAQAETEPGVTPAPSAPAQAPESHLDTASATRPEAPPASAQQTLDLGSVLVRGYGRHLAAGGLLSLLIGLLWRQRQRGIEVRIRYRL